MKIGIFLTNQNPVGSDMVSALENQCLMTRLARDRGWDAVATGQPPHPPIWVAANNDNASRRAARIGDTWFVNPHATMTTITRQMELYRAELTRVGKPFPRVLPMIKEIFCAKDTRTALEMAGPS